MHQGIRSIPSSDKPSIQVPFWCVINCDLVPEYPHRLCRQPCGEGVELWAHEQSSTSK
jgi:hypothetical protein